LNLDDATVAVRPDEAMVEAAALALFAIDYPNTDWHDGISADMHEDFRGYARAVLSVPVVRDALARDAQVREIVARNGDLFESLRDIAAMYPVAATAARLVATPGDRDDSEEQQ
jgi:hypothetical protein